MKTYKLIFLTKEGVELQSKEIEANNLKEAKQVANNLKANSMINDLHKIEVRPQEKLLRVTFENYYCKTQSVYTQGTHNQNKAIKAVKTDQAQRQFKYISCEVVNESELKNLDLDYILTIK